MLGHVIEPHVVQVNSLGHLTLAHQKLFSSNFEYYGKFLDETDKSIVLLLEELDQERIVKKYHTKGSIRPAEFFKKHWNEDLQKKFIRPFIESKLAEAIPLMRGKPIYCMGKDDNPASEKVTIASQLASVLFHFRRVKGEGTNYFPTIKCGDEKVHFKGNHGILLVNQPAWLLNQGVLYSFEKKVDGNKLKPFLRKKFIRIPPETESTYFEKFVVPLVEKFDVYAEGFHIDTTPITATPVISIDSSWGDRVRLNLSFRYDQHLFPYHAVKRVSVFLEALEDDEYVFHRINRNKKWEESKRNVLEALGLSQLQGSSFVLESANQHYNAMDWLHDNQEGLEEEGFELKQDEENTYFIGRRKIELVAEENGDWFDVKAKVIFGEFEIPFIQLRKYIMAEQREFRLPNGEIAIIPAEWFTQFGELMELGNKEAHGIKLHRHHYKLLEDLQDSRTETDIRQRAEGKDSWELHVPGSVSENFNGILRPYQLDGFKWFYFLKNNRFGGCLADDMGLGKTIQTLALLAQEHQQLEVEEESEEVIVGASSSQMELFASAQVQESKTRSSAAQRPVSLVVVPTSLIYNWSKEAAQFVPDLQVYLHSGTNRLKSIEEIRNYDLVITTYGVLRLDIEFLKDLQFHYVILDESQAIKNPASLTAKTVKMLAARNRLVLTGTPIENTVVDLWSQMNFINPGLLGSYSYFQKRFVIPIEKEGNAERRNRLHEIIAPFILRRTKQQVADDLPDKYEQIHYCEMTEEQQKVYDETKSAFRNRILETVSSQGMGKSKMQILKGLILLRQMANHPRLSDPDFLGDSGKFLEMTRMLNTAMGEGHKILLFSQFVKHLQLFRTYLEERNIQFCYLDGTTPVKERLHLVEEFNSNPGIKIFLISLKAGGTGLNLTSADYVFLADPWWNPAVERQAIDRAHRIGQTQKVFSYKFITKDSVEEKIVSLQTKKLQLAGDVIERDEQILKNLELVDLEELLE